MKYFLTFFLGGIVMSFLVQPAFNNFEYQIYQRDSVNTHNTKVIESLHEYIRLDSINQLEQLYPKK